MQDMLSRIFGNLVGRIHGPMNFRLFLQPLMAVIFATLDGRKDAREGRAPYLWTLVLHSGHRRDLMRSGWKSVGRIFVLALILDGVYQVKVLSWFYPGEALLTALVLAVLPYVLLRGIVNRLTPRKR
jgi:hypothetical protein